MKSFASLLFLALLGILPTLGDAEWIVDQMADGLSEDIPGHSNDTTAALAN